MSSVSIVERGQQFLIENYGRLPLAVTRGEGSICWDEQGRRYIDLFVGFGAGGIVGHCDPRVSEALARQATTLLSHGNLFFSEPQVQLAELLVRHSFGDGSAARVFFCHSGAEANEAALKLARLAANGGAREENPAPGYRYKTVSFFNCFHGRTMGGLSLTPRSFQLGFDPMLPGNSQVPLGDLAAVEEAIDAETAAIFIEPIQGEGGMNLPAVEFMRGLRDLCDKHRLLLVCDEVWTAPARTGQWFAYQHYGIEPDIVTLAKAVGGGVPLGAMIARGDSARFLVPGTHGCTMGGNPLCAAAAVAALEAVENDNLCERAHQKGEAVMAELRAAKIGCVKDVRGKGLMIGIELAEDAAPAAVVKACLAAGLLIGSAKNQVLRLAPALNVPDGVLEEGLKILVDTLQSPSPAANQL